LLNTHSLMNNIFFFFFAFFLYLDIYGWILLAIAYVTMLSFDCVLKPITHSFNACESQHTSNSRYYVQRTLFRRVLACANFIQHKWLVDHSTSIATKAEMLVPSISGILLCNLYSATHTYRAHKRR
jgi:hypothetical protein